MSEALLRAERLSKSFGDLAALRDVSLDVQSGSIAAVIGPNGAGKSTLFNLITGILHPNRGRIIFNGCSIEKWPTDRIASAGVSRTFQNGRLFAYVPAIENVMTGEHALLHATLLDSLLHTPRQRREEREARDRAHELLRFVGLEGAAESYARNLPYGSQRRLEIARALAARPKLLLLDEPAAGMNPREKRELLDLVRAIRDRGTTIVLIEHDMGLVMNVSDAVTVLDHGERIAHGPPAEVRSDPRVIGAYLGTPAA